METVKKLSEIGEAENKIKEYSGIVENGFQFDPALYTKYGVKRGLRDIDGRGVLVGLTKIAEVKAYIIEDNEMIPCEGKLFYRGYSINDIVKGFVRDKRRGFEEIVYLLFFGELPSAQRLAEFNELLSYYKSLPMSFTRDVILKSPSRDLMNSLARSVLTLYSYDDAADDVSISNVLRQSIQMVARFPRLCVYGYHASNHFHNGQSLYIHSPSDDYSIAENILHMLRPDKEFTPLEAEVLDIAMVVHAEHGGGNNSTYTTRVVTSSGTDTYSAVAAGIGSLKGPKHGGANIKVAQMFDDLKANVKNRSSETEIKQYLADLLDRKVFDKAGLIYGMGHAVYSLSDPRANIFKEYTEELSKEKGLEEDFALYSEVERLAPEVIGEKRQIYKGVSANVDFYSGFVYNMLGLPQELFTPVFACARVAGWCAHRMEELVGKSKITRPAYKTVQFHDEKGKVITHRNYVPINKRG